MTRLEKAMSIARHDEGYLTYREFTEADFIQYLCPDDFGMECYDKSVLGVQCSRKFSDCVKCWQEKV